MIKYPKSSEAREFYRNTLVEGIKDISQNKMVRTRRQRASDETGEAVHSVGTETAPQPGTDTGASSSNWVERPARTAKRRDGVASTGLRETQNTVASPPQTQARPRRMKWTTQINEFIMRAY